MVVAFIADKGKAGRPLRSFERKGSRTSAQQRTIIDNDKHLQQGSHEDITSVVILGTNEYLAMPSRTTTVRSRNSKTDRNRLRRSIEVPMAAAPVSMCPPVGFLLGVNRPCARNSICACAAAFCVLGLHPGQLASVWTLS